MEKSLRLFSRLPLHGVPHIDHDKMDLLTVLFKGRLKVRHLLLAGGAGTGPEVQHHRFVSNQVGQIQ